MNIRSNPEVALKVRPKGDKRPEMAGRSGRNKARGVEEGNRGAKRPDVSNSEGAVMIIAVFMAMVAIGALYFLVGLGDVIVGSERMQDAADATAFSSAVVQARGMNLLALLNIMMASLMAVLVLLSMLASLFQVGVAILAAASFLIPGAASLIPPTNSAAQGFRKAEQKAKPPIEKTIKALHQLQAGLRMTVPMIARANAMSLSGTRYKPVVQGGVTFPIFDGLPTTKGDFKTLCEKAGELAGAIASVPITTAIGDNFLSRKLASRAKGLGRRYARFYCGEGERPAASDFRVDASVPELQSSARITCEEQHDEEACRRYEKELEAAKESYNHDEQRCEGEGKAHCENLRRRARRECKPENAEGPVVDYTWSEKHYTRNFQHQRSAHCSHQRSRQPYRPPTALQTVSLYAEWAHDTLG
jgi:hypothetical protein